MLDIALCDDDPKQLDLIAFYTSEFMQSNQHEFKIYTFNHPDNLLSTCENKRFHLYVLDIVMPLVNGIEVGRTIRKHDHEAQIIYTTAEPSFALQSFVANPVNFLIKPIAKQQYFDTLSLATSRLDIHKESTFVVKTQEGMRVLRLSEVICCEYTRHTAIYTLVDAKTVTTRTIKGTFTQHVAPLLEDRRFLRPHASYVLNMDNVESFTRNRFILRSGCTIPIVVKQYREVRDIYLNYLMSKERL
jgi:DNA-binding LytR/AlgR family response regulator